MNVPFLGGARAFNGLRKSTILAALEKGATEQQVRKALKIADEPFPPAWKWQKALVTAIKGKPAEAARTPGNVHIQQDLSEADQKRIDDFWGDSPEEATS